MAVIGRALLLTEEVSGVRNGRVMFTLEEGRKLTLTQGDPQLRHLDRAWASTVHAFQGRTVEGVIAAMEANHPQLTTAKAFYVEISRARDRAELVTDDAKALRERLETVTGERISALEGIDESVRPQPGLDAKALHERETTERELADSSSPGMKNGREMPRAKAPEPGRGKRIEMDLGL